MCIRDSHRSVVVQSINNGGQEFGHIRLCVVGLFQKLRITVVQVRGDDALDIALFIIFVKFIEAVGEEAEGLSLIHI